MRPLPQLLLYMTAWVVTSLAISEITISLSGDWRPFATPTAKAVEGPGGFAAQIITVESFFGLLNGVFHFLLLSALLRRLPRGGNMLVPSLVTGVVLGMICVGGWSGLLYALMGHLSHPGVGQRVAVGILPYIVSGAVAGCLRPQPSS